MIRSRLLIVLCAAIVFAAHLVSAPPAAAQIVDGIPPNALNAGYLMEAERESLRNMQRMNAQARGARETAAQSLANAQTAVTAAGASCQVSQATLLGKTADDSKIYEAACAAGPGYLLIASTPPQAVSCLVAAASATQGAAQPGGETTFVCKLPANQDGTATLAAYAREAGITCQVDSAGPVGTANGKTVYEIGCAGADGYRLKQTDAGWEKTECWIVVSAGSSCARTTADEQFATMKARLAGTEAAACQVNGGRFMGANPNGAFYEARCENADGYIFHVKNEVTDRVYACAIAAPIGGGCTLTRGPPPGAASGPPSPR
jgi:hypothetical protein